MDKYEKATLTLVNRIRKLQGKTALTQLLKGNTGDGKSCPIANSISGRADDSEITFKVDLLGEMTFMTPDTVGEFINMFDDESAGNKYTHLMNKKSLADHERWIKEDRIEKIKKIIEKNN